MAEPIIEKNNQAPKEIQSRCQKCFKHVYLEYVRSTDEANIYVCKICGAENEIAK